MLRPRQLKPLFLSSERETRWLVAEYFHEGWIMDPDVPDLVLAACDKYGYENNVLPIFGIHPGLLSDEHVLRLAEAFKETDHENLQRHIERVLSRAPLDVLHRNWTELEGIGKLDHPQYPARRRMRAHDMSPEEAWAELLNLADRYDEADKADIGQAGAARIESLVEALGEQCYPPAEKVLSRLLKPEVEGSWLEIFLIDMAGALRLRKAVPLLVRRFHEDTDLMLEHCNIALARIGSKQAIRLVRRDFWSGSWNYRNYGSSVFSNIKCLASERAILSLLRGGNREVDADSYDQLIFCLFDLFSKHAFTYGRRFLAEGRVSTWDDMRRRLIVLAEAYGLDTPEVEEWKRDIDLEQEARREQRAFEPAEPIADPEEDTNVETYTREMPKIGRNDPCPCGSGRKYKQCCGR